MQDDYHISCGVRDAVGNLCPPAGFAGTDRDSGKFGNLCESTIAGSAVGDDDFTGMALVLYRSDAGGNVILFISNRDNHTHFAGRRKMRWPVFLSPDKFIGGEDHEWEIFQDYQKRFVMEEFRGDGGIEVEDEQDRSEVQAQPRPLAKEHEVRAEKEEIPRVHGWQTEQHQAQGTAAYPEQGRREKIDEDQGRPKDSGKDYEGRPMVQAEGPADYGVQQSVMGEVACKDRGCVEIHRYVGRIGNEQQQREKQEDQAAKPDIANEKRQQDHSVDFREDGAGESGISQMPESSFTKRQAGEDQGGDYRFDVALAAGGDKH